MKKLLIVVFALAIALTFIAPAANADVLFNNLGNSSTGEGTVGANTWWAQSFSTGSSSYNLSSVVLDMSVNTAGTTATVSIFTNTGTGNGQPGTLVGTLTSPGSYTVYNNASLTTFTASGINLNPNSIYWVVLNLNGSTGNLFWQSTPDTSGNGSGFRVYYSGNNGSSWGTAASTNPFMMDVNANSNAVPLPAGILLFTPGLLGLGVLRRRFKR